MDYGRTADELSTGLHLDSPPVALSFVQTVPPGVPTLDQEVPSACTLWRRAESDVFFAPANKHFNCPIGAMTMGFDMPSAVKDQLMDVVGTMTRCGYIALEEAEKIPAVKGQKAGIVYGPLKAFPIHADLILVWLTPKQAMLFSESVGTCRWTEASPAAVFGRPACAALAVAFEQSQPALSLGCMGMRACTEISQDRLLAVIPGKKIGEFVDSLRPTLDANENMRTFYEIHKGKFAEVR